jgi:isocitrate lyase
MVGSQLSGLHSNEYISGLFAKAFGTKGMKVSLDPIQRKERDPGTDILTHQKVRTSRVGLVGCGQWSGADYVDNLMKTVTGGVSSTAAMGNGVTEI